MNDVNNVVMETESEIPFLANDSINWDIEIKKSQFQEKKQNISERKKYALLAFILSIIWLLIVGVILTLQVLKQIDLPNYAYWLLSAVTIQICRLPIKVFKYLFENTTTE